MTNQKLSFAVMALLTVHQVQAAIAENGLWTDNDWYDQATQIGVRNGIPYSNDATVGRRLTAPLSTDSSEDYDYTLLPNVQRVQGLFSEQ